MSEAEHERLREVAQTATSGPWRLAEQTHGEWYGIQSDFLALGTAFERADAEHIATFDPPTVLALLDRLVAIEALAAEWQRIGDGLPIPHGSCLDMHRHHASALRDALTGPPRRSGEAS